MKILDIYNELLYDKNRLSIVYDKADLRAVQGLLEHLGTIDHSKEYEVLIRPKKKHRSLDANGYFWKLCSELAEATSQMCHFKKNNNRIKKFEGSPLKTYKSFNNGEFTEVEE